MATKSPKELFIQMLSMARHGTERSIQFFNEISQAAQDPDVKQSLDARAFVAKSDLMKLDHCFSLIGEKPVTPSGRVQEVFIEDFRKELNAIESPIGKLIYVLKAANWLTHVRIAGYETMVALADRSGNYGVGVLLESCLADHIAFAERNRRFIRRLAETKIAEKMAA